MNLENVWCLSVCVHISSMSFIKQRFKSYKVHMHIQTCVGPSLPERLWQIAGNSDNCNKSDKWTREEKKD